MAREPGPVLPRWLLGIELQRLRKQAGLTVAQVAKHLRVYSQTIHRHENGSSGIKPADFDAVMDLYGVGHDDRERLAELHRLGKQPGWWTEYGDMPLSTTVIMLGMEAAAVRIRSYDEILVPGLLQTDDYAREVMQAVVPSVGLDIIEQGIRIRHGRQSTVFTDDATEVHFLVSELALRRPIRNADVMRDQIRRLVDDLPASATLQVVPFSAGPHPSIGTFAVCDFPTEVIPHGVYAEGLTAIASTYWQDPDIIVKFDRAWGQTRALALSEEESAQLLMKVVEEL